MLCTKSKKQISRNQINRNPKKLNFENIKIQNTTLVGANFVRCNLSGSQFENVDISGINLDGAQLFNCKWKNIKIHELNKLDGHSHYVKSVCFSPDGTILASYSFYKSIRLWDVKTGKEIQSTDKSYKDILAYLKLHYFTTILQKVPPLILQYYLYPKHQYFYHHYQSQKEVSFWKTIKSDI